MNEPDLYTLVDQYVNAEDIHRLLKGYKDQYPTEIQLSGTKAELLAVLKSSVIANRIPLGRVHDLLREGEENGDQHIFYFEPRTREVRRRCQNGDAVAESLFGPDWHTTQGFPKLTGIPDSYTPVDFRIGVGMKHGDWLFKIYGLKLSKRKVGKVTTGLNTFSIQYEETLLRSVCIARWNDYPNHGLLEIRVTRTGRKQRVDVDLNAVWSRLRGAFPREDFVPWDLSVPLRWMIENEESQRKVYSLGSVRVTDSADGVVSFHPHNENERVSDAPIRKKTLLDLLNDGGKCTSLVVTWLVAGSGEAIVHDLRTYLGARASNELVVSARTTSTALQHVIDHLRYFRKQVPEASTPNQTPERDTRSDAMRKSTFEKLRRGYPDFAGVWNALERWFLANNDKRYIVEDQLAKQVKGVDPLPLAAALQVMVREGLLNRAYRLRVPGGEYVGGEFDSFQAIPDEIPDRFHSTTYAAEALDLVTGYRWGDTYVSV